jgi:hypothetical protein
MTMGGRKVTDPVWTALARLPPLASDDADDVRVRSRCHAMLTARRGTVHRRPFRLTDLLMAGAAGLYLVLSAVEAMRLVGG